MENGTTGNYTFLNGNCPDWSCKENLAGLPCSDPANFNDRILPEINGDMTISTCFGQCSEDGSCQAPPLAYTVTVTFRVDMSDYTGNYGTVNLNGSFNGWCGSCAEMTDDDADGVYVFAIDLDNEMSYEYKFTLDGWSSQEEFTEGDPCTSTIGGYINRTLTTGTEAMTLDVVCYNSCSACPSDDLPWSHDCNVDNCDSWTFGNGADIAGSPWQGIDLNFECSTDGPAGPYNQWAGGTGDFTAAPPMNSTTSSNGLLIVDSDLFGADANYSASWIENSWVQTAEPINCGATEFIRMSFQTRYRCWDNGANDDSEKCLVEISRDGVNWPDISTFSEADGTVDYGDGVLVPSRWEVFPGYETGSETDNPSFIDLDISSAAGGQEQVWIRFRWSGTWGYSWEIDDIFLQEAPMNDLRVESYVSTTDYANTGMYELGAIPLGQLTNYQAGVTVKNIGINPQSGVQLNLSADGTTIGTSPLYSLDYDAEETLQAAYALNGLGLGSHTLEFEVSADAEDDYPENNSATRTIEITEYQLGRDNGSMTGLFPSDGTDDFMALNPFVIYEDATIYAIDVAIAAGSESGTIILGHLFDPTAGSFLSGQYDGLMISTEELFLDDSLTNAGDEAEIIWYTMVLEEPIFVDAGQSIAAAFEHYGGSNVQIWESQSTYDQTSWVYGPFGSGQTYNWYYTNDVPMVRLNFNPNAMNSGAGCTDSQACNYNPNAVEDNGSCEYETCEGCMDATACNYDPEATISDAFGCVYPEANYDCQGYCIDLTACNYVDNPPSGGGSVNNADYFEGFEGFIVGDYISYAPDWLTWASGGAGSDMDAQVTNATAASGDNSLHIYGSSPAGGPMDVMLLTDLQSGVYDVSFSMFVPSGGSAYYNVQESTTPGVGWAFESTFNSSGGVQFVMDGADVATGFFPFDTWFSVVHSVDLDSQQIFVQINGSLIGTWTFDSPFGGINFFGMGDGITNGSYFIDNILIEDLLDFDPVFPEACTYPGCQDPEAVNFEPDAGCAAECIYLTYDCASIGEPAWSDELMGLFPDWQEAMHGVAWEGEWVFNIPFAIVEPSSGVTYSIHHVNWTSVEGLPAWLDEADYTLGELAAESQHCIAANGTPSEPGWHEITSTGEVFISIFGQPFSVGEQSFSAWLEVVENPNPIPGCTYATAQNFVAFATLDDGSCEFAGCTDPEAGNFNPLATIDDGSCGEACNTNSDSICETDIDNDGLVSVSDLLLLLGDFGATCTE